jgi:hypothetical protein
LLQAGEQDGEAPAEEAGDNHREEDPPNQDTGLAGGRSARLRL